MPTPRETILQALLAALQSVPGATVLRGATLPERTPTGGLLILRDGDPGTPEVTLSPLQYHFEHRAEVEVIVQGKTPAERDVAFDVLLAELASATTADRTLGGLCDWVEAEAPQPVDLPVEGAEALKAAIVPVILTYTMADPLG
ncbi:MAG TPA: acyl-CoA transferase [Rhodobacteraceae bacterium]|nr:acyl-CoA transferase [Paracoccaceae bacterium]